jgi:hypothetical protein
MLTVVSGEVPRCSKRSLAVRALSSSDALSSGLASGAEAGVRHVLEMVRQEFDLAMALFRLPEGELNYGRSHSAIVR